MSVALLRSHGDLPLTKIWKPEGDILAAANVPWFEAREVAVNNLGKILDIIKAFESNPCVALVKEAIAPGVDPTRIRRTCTPGIDKRTGEVYPAGLCVVARNWLVLDIEKLARPKDIDWWDGEALAAYAQRLLPFAFQNAACVWQFSGSSGHPSKRAEIRLHMFFILSEPVLPKAWKLAFAHLPFVDQSVFDNAKIIFTAAPVIMSGQDPLPQRHGILSGEPVVSVPADVKARNEELAQDALRPKPSKKRSAVAPMPEAAAAFVEIISKSNVLRSQHPAYLGDRARRLAFCSMISLHFGIVEEEALEVAFQDACIGDDDPNGDHDTQQALEWAQSISPSGRNFSVRKLLCDAAVALHEIGEMDLANRSARFAMIFRKLEQEFIP